MRRGVCRILLVGCACAGVSPGAWGDGAAREWIDDGVRWHDAGRYDEAMASFRRALDAGPDEIERVEAVHELSRAMLSAGRYRDCVDVAARHLERAGALRAAFLELIARCTDAAGEPRRAAELFDRAMREFPERGLLPLHAGVLRIRLGEPATARELLERAVRLDPARASAHLYLAVAFERTGHPGPALLALLRFLSLEPEGERAVSAARIALDVLTRGDAEPAAFARRLEADPAAAGELLVDRVDLELTALERPDGAGPGAEFAREAYLPFVRDLRQDGLLEAFVYRSFAAVSAPTFEEWLASHPAKAATLDGFLRAAARPPPHTAPLPEY